MSLIFSLHEVFVRLNERSWKREYFEQNHFQTLLKALQNFFPIKIFTVCLSVPFMLYKKVKMKRKKIEGKKLNLLPGVGFEPTRAIAHWNLSPTP